MTGDARPDPAVHGVRGERPTPTAAAPSGRIAPGTATPQTAAPDAVPPRGARLRHLVILGALSAFGPLSMDMYLPALPSLTSGLHTSQLAGQLTMSSCMVGLAVGQLAWGPLSDSRGRRRPLVAGVAGFAACSLACAVAPNVVVLIVLRLLQGLAGAAGIVIARAMVRDLYSGTDAARIFAGLMLVSGLAPVIAPVLGGQLLRATSWHGIFVVLTGVGAALTLAATFLPETLPPASRRSGGPRDAVRMFRMLVSDRVFMGYGLSGALVLSGMFTYISASSFVLQDTFGLSAQWFSAVFAMNSVGIVAASQVTARLVGRFGPNALLRAGVVLAGTAGTALLLVTVGGLGLAAVLPCLFVVVCCTGLVAPTSTALALTPYGAAAGSAAAQLGALQFVAGGLVALLAGTGGGHTALPMAAVICAVDVLALPVLLTATRRREVLDPAT